MFSVPQHGTTRGRAGGKVAESREWSVVEGYYQRTPEGLTYRGWPVLIGGDRGLVAVIDESATDRAVRLGYEHDAHWDVVDGCG